mmetsp:Transcript_1741/g.6821  ORF Transcript_1741/g.6821 Transcript_1741/m.6821 type:complete len:263 (-) Transcript_1741:1420-2208(-)
MTAEAPLASAACTAEAKSPSGGAASKITWPISGYSRRLPPATSAPTPAPQSCSGPSKRRAARRSFHSAAQASSETASKGSSCPSSSSSSSASTAGRSRSLRGIRPRISTCTAAPAKNRSSGARAASPPANRYLAASRPSSASNLAIIAASSSTFCWLRCTTVLSQSANACSVTGSREVPTQQVQPICMSNSFLSCAAAKAASAPKERSMTPSSTKPASEATAASALSRGRSTTGMPSISKGGVGKQAHGGSATNRVRIMCAS